MSKPPTLRLRGLRYVSDTMPGITRRRCGKGFSYRLPSGRTLRARSHLRRIRALAIPPAYEKVWICPLPHGHLQATGYDARARKQYRYHALWQELRGQRKFAGLANFARKLPEIRHRVALDLGEDKPTRIRLLAAIVRILDRTGLRVGNDVYAEENHSHGVTTLRKRHVSAEASQVHLEFRGKSGRQNVGDLRHPAIAALIRSCHELPGQRLFQYRDGEEEDGSLHAVTSQDVNAYLQEIVGPGVSAKDFRTWIGTVACAEYLAALARGRGEAAASESALSREIVASIRAAAETLQNRAATCRKYYVHPAVIEAHRTGRLAEVFAKPPGPGRVLKGLRPLTVAERVVLSLIA